VKLELGRSWAKKLQHRVERYEFEVGVLDDKPHRFAKEHGLFETPDLGQYAGGPVRKATRVESDLSVGDVLIKNQDRMNTNLLLEPFQKENSEILRFTTTFLKMVSSGKASLKRLENLLQAIVRNPILKQEYGPNSSTTADNKGFDRHLIDTGQMFKSIRARVRTKGKK
jgi:hypothetical protein